tara:strand:+ start:364 stop:783 length:420 start_codon:yes stop_codon:yes gene_type:complete
MANGTIAFDTLQTSGQISGTARSVDTEHIVKGSAKFLVTYTSVTTTATFSSFNFSSLTDNGTGQATHSFTNNFSADKEYVVAASACFSSEFTTTFTAAPAVDSKVLTDSVKIVSKFVQASSGTVTDLTYVSAACIGDLA